MVKLVVRSELPWLEVAAHGAVLIGSGNRFETWYQPGTWYQRSIHVRSRNTLSAHRRRRWYMVLPLLSLPAELQALFALLLHSKVSTLILRWTQGLHNPSG